MTRAGRAERQRRIVRLLQEERFSRQEEISSALEREGYGVSQATLSRDLRELGVVRAPGPDGARYVLPEAEPAPRGRELFALEVSGVVANESVVLVKTWPGRAQGVAISLDRMDLPDLLGTVAGDDTVIAVPRSNRRTAALRRRIEEILRPA